MSVQSYSPSVKRQISAVLLGTTMLVSPAWAQSVGDDAPSRTLSKDPLPDYGGVDLTTKSATDLAGMLQRGETTSREIVLQYMYKIQQFDHAGPALRSVQQINPDILALADQADAQRAQAKRDGRTLPPLFGVPVLLKANIDTADALRTTVGDAALLGSRPVADATLVSGLREQGLLLLGKANMGQWAGFVSNNDSSTGGQTISPFDPTIKVAGSSSGSSIAVAMHFAPLAAGTQTTDSIIYPAQQQGIYGLKPTAGLVSTTGVAPYSQVIDVAGPMAGTVRDLALMLNGMVKQDASDTRSQNYVRPADYGANLNGDLTGLKVGLYTAAAEEDPQRSPQYSGVVGGMLAAAKADVININRADVDAAVKTAVSKMSDADLAQFAVFADSSTDIPTDPAERAAFLSDYRATFADGADQVKTAMRAAFYAYYRYDLYASVSAYLDSRVAAPDDYKSALVRFLGDKYNRLGNTDNDFAKTIKDLYDFAMQNEDLDGYDTNFYGYIRRKLGPYSSVAALKETYLNWTRISAALLSDVRGALGVDAVIGLLGTNDGRNDGPAAFTFTTMQMSSSPQLNVPAQINGVAANILIDADPYQEQTLLRIGAALQMQLNSDAFKQYQALAPTPPATGFTN